MRPMRFSAFRTLAVSAFVLAFSCAFCRAQDPPGKQDPPAKDEKSPPTTSLKDAPVTRVTIEITGGSNNAPVENASVYVKYVEEHAVKKDKRLELNVKSNREGVAHVPGAPLGRALIQVVADGWKPFGRWYDINEMKQVVKIHLDRPPKWY